MDEKGKNKYRDDFLRAYSNLPLNTREEIILVLKDGDRERPITWDVAYFEIKNNTPISDTILEKLKGLKII